MGIVFLFVYGLVLGSFFNVVGLRVPLKQSIVSPRSACPTCGHQLKPYELIPVISYLLQGGKCRGCQSRISPIYPFFELLTGILFATSPLVIGWSSELVIALTLISMFMIIIVSDIHYMLIPDKILIWFAGIFYWNGFFAVNTLVGQPARCCNGICSPSYRRSCQQRWHGHGRC